MSVNLADAKAPCLSGMPDGMRRNLAITGQLQNAPPRNPKEAADNFLVDEWFKVEKLFRTCEQGFGAYRVV